MSFLVRRDRLEWGGCCSITIVGVVFFVASFKNMVVQKKPVYHFEGAMSGALAAIIKAMTSSVYP